MIALPTKAFLVIGLFLGSSEAWAQQGEASQSRSSPASLGAQPTTQALDSEARYPSRARQSRELEQQIRSTRKKGPVDFLSLSLGGSLLVFLVVATLRRRKGIAEAFPDEVDAELPIARVHKSNEES